MFKKIILLFLFSIITLILNAQDKIDVKVSLDQYNKNFPTEKLYLSFDKPYYNVGDTLWLKSFLLAGNLTKSTISDKIYVELYNDSSKYVETKVIALNNGLGYGEFVLNNTLKEGTYTIRAYTNWQQNFNSSYFFQKSFYVGNANDKTLLLESYQKLETAGTKRILALKVRLSNIKNEAHGLRDMEIILLSDKKKLMKIDLQSNQDGVIETKVPLLENKLNNKYSLVFIDKKDNTRKSILPILLQDAEDVDMQFMPEGGYMVNNIYGKVAFKAIGLDGLGKVIAGKIINSKLEVLAEFTSNEKGMGSFFMLPQTGDSYTAIVNSAQGEQKFNLPIAKEEGTSLRIDHLSKQDSIYIYIKASPTKRIDLPYHLLIQSANEEVMSISLSLKNGFSNLKLPKLDFPDGVIHFTLFSSDNIPLNERQAFINHNQKINIAISPNKNSFALRDSIALELTATNENGKPLSGTYSISVTDDSQVKQAANGDNIISYFLLQSGLNGNVEDADWYFNNTDAATKLALDQLLLTQGWIGYKWDEILKPTQKPKFRAEKDNNIVGKLTNTFNKPAANINLTLLSLGKNIFLTDTTSNSEGNFIFKNLPLVDTIAYSIKIKNAKGKTSTANIKVDEFEPARDIQPVDFITPWYVNPDSTKLKYYTSAAAKNKRQQDPAVKSDGTLLKEVEIKGKKKQEEFRHNVSWDASLFKSIDEEELKKMPRKTLIDLLTERVPGFRIGSLWADGCFSTLSRTKNHSYQHFVVNNMLVSKIVIDGINTTLASLGVADRDNTDTQKSVTALDSSGTVLTTNRMILNALSAEDVVNITVYKGCAYYYLDITTRGKKGPWLSFPAGMYVHRPLPIHMAKEFYSPKYNVHSDTKTPDYRSTIFWDANVVTDENGKAKISFYAADKPTTYTIKVEGTDLYGRFGFQKSTIIVESKSSSK